jgi:TonB family protein
LIAQDPRVAPLVEKDPEVVLNVLVGENGSVLAIRKVKGASVLVGPAEKAVRKWTYRPATKGGLAVQVWIQVPISFKAKGG